MGIRFRKSIKLAPGIKLNVSKESVGLTASIGDAHVSVNTKGRRTTSVNIPGTGISYVDVETNNRDKLLQAYKDTYNK